ncbi:hypothetical protein GSI_04226 [Ganoderma sinense ZZ0214-1]|uniref:DUF6534 domain-containing protein n=1 Tax=Ganoderma sinense ZZ0214-1 TaxID=1077348 RepID=A0A2G8SIK7_9APHY|nr:hypothetical protein GSI_04226 [Ganoderma sinense ZZ0214-1]
MFWGATKGQQVDGAQPPPPGGEGAIATVIQIAIELLFVRIDLGSTLGVTFLGVAVSSMIYGFTCLQTFNYYHSSRAKADNAFLRCLVSLLFLCDTFHQILVLHATYHYLILGFAQPVTLSTTLVWSLPAEIIMNVCILAFLLNSFLTHRLWRLSHHVYLAVCAALLTVANIAVNLGESFPSTLISRKPPFISISSFCTTHSLRDSRIHGTVGLSISLATDLFISLSLCYYLHQSRTGLRGSDGIITKLIALTITTGMLTTLCNLADVIAYITARDNLYDLFFNFMLAKLYANALLTTLNTRQYVHGLIGDAALSKAPLIPDGSPTVPAFVESQPESDMIIHITSEKMEDLESVSTSSTSNSSQYLTRAVADRLSRTGNLGRARSGARTEARDP